MTIFFIGDTHWGHSNIIKYCSRPFTDVDEMNRKLTEYWNQAVSPTDTVIHLGDFSFMQDEKAAKVLALLNGKKILVRGNHDKSPDRMLKIGFDLVVESMMMHVEGIGKCFFTHYPIESDSALQEIFKETDCYKHIHGHSHNGRPLYDGLRFNVSVENINYQPIPASELRRVIV